MAHHRGEGLAQVGHGGQGLIRLVIDPVLAGGEGSPALVQLVQAVGGASELAVHAVQAVENGVDAVGDGVIGILHLFLGLPQVGNLIHLGQGHGLDQEGEAVEGEVLRPHPQGEVLLLPGRTM